MGRNVFSDEVERKIAERIANGEKRVHVAKELDVHRNTIKNICARYPELFPKKNACA